MISALVILIGYLLGSVSPAFLLGKILKGIDIRQHGTKNAGTTNVKHLLGLGPAITTAIFDLSKGVLAIWIASLFSIPTFLIYFAGFAAIVGHIFPFYLRFRGGQGVATAVGLLFFFATKLILTGAINWPGFLPGLISSAILVLSLLFIRRDERALGIFVLPPIIFFLIANTRHDIELYFLIAILLFIVSINILVAFQQKIFAAKIPEGKSEHLLSWRTFARPLAILLIVSAYIWPETVVLYISGSLASIVILLDLIRLISNKANVALFGWRGFLKQKEKRSFSSMTFFLTAVFLLYLLFPREIASISILFIIFGDLAAKFFGIFYSRIFFWPVHRSLGGGGDKSVEGTLAHFAFSLLFATIFIQIVPFPYWLVMIGAATAAAVDAFSLFGIDDNFTVGLISAGTMLAIRTLI